MEKGDMAPRSAVGGLRIAPRAGFITGRAPPSERMHATRDTSDVIYNQRCGRRVMPDVRRHPHLLPLTTKKGATLWDT